MMDAKIVIDKKQRLGLIRKVIDAGYRFSQAKGEMLPYLIQALRPMNLWVQKCADELRYFVDGGGGIGGVVVDPKDAWRILRYAVRHDQLAA